jgi:multidrug efflux pump
VTHDGIDNAIVLMDFARLLMERSRRVLGLPEGAIIPIDETREALVQAGRTRLRPVLLTAVPACR